MLDEIVQFIFWEVIGNIFFRLGYFYLILLTFGKIMAIKKTPIIRFFIAVFGMLWTFVMVCLIIYYI
jgi:hypothetical protein